MIVGFTICIILGILACLHKIIELRKKIDKLIFRNGLKMDEIFGQNSVVKIPNIND
jgi:hypothetical protein